MAKLDLNLMAVLEAVYDEGSTSRAGEVLFLSQSAVSHALARLRDIYQDPLFIRQGHRMLPTPLTERIIAKVKLGLKELRGSLDDAHCFDPLSHQQEFHLGMRDAIETALLAPLIAQLNKTAPLVHISNRHIAPKDIESQLNIGKLDACIDLLKPVASQVYHTLLFTEQLALVGRKNHPVFKGQCTVERFLQYQQVLVTPLENEPEWVDHALASRGLRRDVGLRCQSYSSALQVLLSSDHLSIMPRGFVELQKQFVPIKFADVPFEVPNIEIHLYWHQRHDSDPANKWLRQQLVQALSKVPSIQLNKTAMALVNLTRDN